MYAFEIVTIVVAALSALLCLTRYMRPSRVIAELGRQGAMWFEHAEDRTIADAPPEDAVEAPIPRRPLRGRY
jgi:hypothetical protein